MLNIYTPLVLGDLLALCWLLLGRGRTWLDEATYRLLRPWPMPVQFVLQLTLFLWQVLILLIARFQTQILLPFPCNIAIFLLIAAGAVLSGIITLAATKNLS